MPVEGAERAPSEQDVTFVRLFRESNDQVGLPEHVGIQPNRLKEWSSSGRMVVVSACEVENEFFFPVVPFRCCDGAHRFSETTSRTIVHSRSGNAWSYRRLWAYGFLRLSGRA